MSDPMSEERETLLEQRLEIETPERVHIVHELAGIGSRFAAGTLDLLVLMLPACAALLAVALLAPGALGGGESVTVVLLAGVGVLVAIYWSYYLGFELFWGGQTPGKRLLRLRVVSEDGGPASTAGIVVRNVLRIVDGLPVMLYVLGGIVMFVNRHSRRVGDLAGGTVVVREREERLAVERLAAAPAPGGEGNLSREELDRVRRFLVRRGELAPGYRDRVARSLAEEIAAAHDLSAADPEAMLALLASGRTPREVRALQGPAAAQESAG